MEEDKSEKPALTKAEKFAANPDKFIDIDDVVMCCVRSSDSNYGTIHGACKRAEMEIALTRLTYKTFMLMQGMDIGSEMSKPKIIGRHNGAPLYKGR